MDEEEYNNYIAEITGLELIRAGDEYTRIYNYWKDIFPEATIKIRSKKKWL